MYTNIPINEGIEAFRVELDKREDQTIPTEFLIKLLRLVLESNLFEFNKEFWLQLWAQLWEQGLHQHMPIFS